MNEILSRECPAMSQVTKTAISIQGASTSEYGRIIIFKKDGTEAATFGLTGDIRIGRDRNSDIRLKIPSVSRNHARVYQDENGNCNIENLSSGNVTTVNGEPVHSSIILKDGDVFCVGLREFVYQNNDKMISSDSNANLIIRHVPILETIDESLTLDFAKHLPQKARGKPLTPIRENLNEATSPMKISTMFDIVLDKSSACANKPSTPKSNKKPSTPKPVKSPGDSLKKMNAATVKQVNENIKDAINARRKSFGASITSKSPKASKSHTPIKKVEQALVGQALTSSQNETLLQAVNARRKSMSNISIVPTVDPVAVMKNEINFIDATKSMPATSIEEMGASPIRQAIDARRRNSLSVEDIKVSSEPLATGAFEGLTIVVPHEPKRDHTEQFTTSSISRRMSVGGPVATTVPVPRQSKRNSIAAPLYTSSRLSLSKKVLGGEVNANVVAELSIDEDIVLSCNATDRDSILTFFSTSSEVVKGNDQLSNTPIKSVEQRGVVIKQAICVQLAVDAFANELEMQGVPAGRAYATAIDTYLSNPSAFSPKPVRTKTLGPGRRDSLLVSLEAKAHITGSSLFGANGGDQAQLSCDLIAALTESDMDIIDAYALRLEVAGGDAGESYAIALDAFVRGVEHCHLKVKVETAPIVFEVSVSVPTEILVAVEQVPAACVVEQMVVCDVSGCELPPPRPLDFSTEDVDPNMGASLRALFELPSDYEGRDEADDDDKLVSRYAEDLRDEACIDAAVAYGIALDTFLADPIAFRDQIGGVKARLQEQYQREAFQTPEYEYDFYYEDEAHSLAKSTVKKIEFPSNSHIFFNSPTPATTPCKMASLCENGVDEDENEDNSIVKSSIKLTSLDVEVVEMESMKFEIDQSSVLSDANTDVSGSEVLPICPTTPSRACFESAFTVLKSVKKSPFKASVSKTEVQTPLKSVKKSPFKASASKKEIQNPTVTIISSNFTFEVESEGLMNSVSTDINEIVEIDTVTNTVNLVADIMTDGGAVFDIPAVELIMLNEEIIPITVDTVISPSLPEAIMTVVAATPVKVESWLASAASSLKKSLPPQSGKKTAPNSARKMKIPTPRQSRLGSSTPLKSAPSCVNLFQETSNVEIIVPAVIESVTSAVEENNEVIGEVLKNEEMEVVKNEEMEVAVKEEVQVVIESISIALEMEIVKAETEIFINIPEVVLESSVEVKSVEVETNTIPSDIDTPQETMILATVETVKTPIKEVCLQEIKMITPGRSTRSKVAAVFSAVKSLTPARVTRSRIPTPAPKVLEPVESVVRTTRSRSTPCKKVNDIPAVAPVEESSAVTDIVPVVAVITNEIDVCIPTPSRRNTLKRSNSILATLSADVIIAKRSRKGEIIEDKFQADVIVPDMIVFPSEEVPDMIVFNDIVATDIAVSVPEVAEVKKRGRPARLVKAVEVEVKEDEEEVALALLCDGCDSEHFLEDLGLKNIPEGDWFCNPCVTKKSLPVVTSARKSSRRSVVTSSILKETPSKSVETVDAVVTRKRTIELTNPSPVLEGRRSARLH